MTKWSIGRTIHIIGCRWTRIDSQGCDSADQGPHILSQKPYAKNNLRPIAVKSQVRHCWLLALSTVGHCAFGQRESVPQSWAIWRWLAWAFANNCNCSMQQADRTGVCSMGTVLSPNLVAIAKAPICGKAALDGNFVKTFHLDAHFVPPPPPKTPCHPFPHPFPNTPQEHLTQFNAI